MPTIRINIAFMMFILSVISILLVVIKRTLRRKGVILDQSVAKEGGEGGLMSFRAWILKKESRIM